MLLTPLLGGPALQRPVLRRLYMSALAMTAAAATVWMLAQYAFQVSLSPVRLSWVMCELYHLLIQPILRGCSCDTGSKRSMLLEMLGCVSCHCPPFHGC